MINHFANLPFWVEIAAAVFVVIGATLALIGAFGLVFIRNFYDRLHAPTLATSWGTAGIVLGSILVFSTLEQRYVIHAIVVGIFVMITTPITLVVLGRAALQRDRAEMHPVPPPTGLNPIPGPVIMELDRDDEDEEDPVDDIIK